MDHAIAIQHPERLLAVAHAPRLTRGSLTTLFALDERLASLVWRAKEPTIGLMRLVWWRDALAALDERPPPGEPLLHAAAALRPDRIAGHELAAMVEGWEVLLDDPDWTAETMELHARLRGAALFGLVGRVLGREHERIEAAGEGWALADLARQASDPATAEWLLAMAEAPLDKGITGGWPHNLRVLGMLAVLAREDVRRGHGALRPPASRWRLLRLLAHRWTGR
jgi:phytoene synthase